MRKGDIDPKEQLIDSENASHGATAADRTGDGDRPRRPQVSFGSRLVGGRGVDGFKASGKRLAFWKISSTHLRSPCTVRVLHPRYPRRRADDSTLTQGHRFTDPLVAGSGHCVTVKNWLAYSGSRAFCCAIHPLRPTRGPLVLLGAYSSSSPPFIYVCIIVVCTTIQIARSLLYTSIQWCVSWRI